MPLLLRSTIVALLLALVSPVGFADEETRGAGPASAVAEIPLDRVERLERAGGCASLRELVGLLDHAEATVREAAFRAVSRMGLRHCAVCSRARRAVADSSPEVRLAALEALGAVGSGEDVRPLLAALDDPDGRIRTAALGALQRLSGTTMPPSRRRWEAWWLKAEAQGSLALTRALDGMESANPVCASVERVRREQVLRQGWIDLALVTKRVAAWLQSSDRALQGEALRLVCGLRLAESEKAVKGALAFVGDENREIGREVASLLGLSAGASGGVAR